MGDAGEVGIVIRISRHYLILRKQHRITPHTTITQPSRACAPLLRRIKSVVTAHAKPPTTAPTPPVPHLTVALATARRVQQFGQPAAFYFESWY